MYALGLATLIYCSFLIDFSEGRVEIQKPYHPYYIKAGSTLELLCNSTERRELQWVHQTPEESWIQTVIDPHQHRHFVIRSTMEEPSGHVESRLFKRHMDLADRGMYKCQDVGAVNQYSVWITVLEFRSENVTAQKDESVTMFCKISGFDQNPPSFEYAWYYEELFIPRDHPRYYMTRLNDSTGVSLKIHQPLKQDIGRYNCVFQFALNIDTLELTHSAFLSGDSLPTSLAPRLASASIARLSVIAALIAAMLRGGSVL